MAGGNAQALKAAALIEKAEKRQKAWFGGTTKHEEAAELLVKAANLYKVAKMWPDAGATFERAADAFRRASSDSEACTQHINAATCYKKDDPARAAAQYERAIAHYMDDGRFTTAAKHKKSVAELYEAEGELDKAIAAYQEAADIYGGEEQSAAANACRLKVALYAAQGGDYARAIEIYESIAAASVDHNLLKWNTKDYYLRALLCYLANGDEVGARRALDRYTDADANFGSSREHTLCAALVDAVEALDVEAYTDAVVEYDTISKLDNWKTSMLLKSKQALRKAAGDTDDGGGASAAPGGGAGAGGAGAGAGGAGAAGAVVFDSPSAPAAAATAAAADDAGDNDDADESDDDIT